MEMQYKTGEETGYSPPKNIGLVINGVNVIPTWLMYVLFIILILYIFSKLK